MATQSMAGPVKPMVDKDKDGISDFVDSDAGDGTKNSNPDKRKEGKRKPGEPGGGNRKKTKPLSNTPKGDGVSQIVKGLVNSKNKPIKIDPTIKPPMGLDR